MCSKAAWLALCFVSVVFGACASPAAPDAVNWAGCLTQSSAVVARVSATRVRFCGRITEAAAQATAAVLQEQDTTLEIASFGGELNGPLDLAELVLAHRLSVDVIGPCLSGCGAYVFLAGETRRISAHGWIGLHNTNTSAVYLARTVSGAELPARDAPLVQRARREQALYERLGVSAWLLLEPQARIGTECIAVNGENALSGETEYSLVSARGFWMPTRAQWRSYGVDVAGFVPSREGEALRLARASLPPEARDVLSLAFSNDALSAPPDQVLAAATWCASPD